MLNKFKNIIQYIHHILFVQMYNCTVLIVIKSCKVTIQANHLKMVLADMFHIYLLISSDEILEPLFQSSFSQIYIISCDFCTVL